MTSIFRRAGRKGWTLKYRDALGKDRMVTRATRAACEERALELRLDPDPGRRVEMHAYAREWLKRSVHTHRRGTIRVYKTAIEEYLIPEFGNLAPNEIKRTKVKDWVSGLLDTGLARSYVRTIKKVLHVLLEEAKDDGLLTVNPASRGARSRALSLTTPKAELAARIKAMEAHQLWAFLDAASRVTPRRWLLYRTLAITGMRIGEALGLQWDDLDLAGQTVNVSRGFTGGRIELTKTGHQRTVDVSAQLVEDFRAWDVRSKAVALAEGRPRPPWLFPSQHRKPVDHTMVEQEMKKALKAAGLPGHYTPHCLRHTYATLQLVGGESVYYVSKQLGHASIQLTVDLYGSWLPAGQPAAADRFEARVSPVSPRASLSLETDERKTQ